MPIKTVFVDGVVFKSYYKEPEEEEVVEKTWGPKQRQAALAARQGKGGQHAPAQAPGMSLGQKVKRVGMAIGGGLAGGLAGSAIGSAVGGTAGGVHSGLQANKDVQEVSHVNLQQPTWGQGAHIAGQAMRGAGYGMNVGGAIGGLAGTVAGARAGWKKGTVQPQAAPAQSSKRIRKSKKVKKSKNK